MKKLRKEVCNNKITEIFFYISFTANTASNLYLIYIFQIFVDSIVDLDKLNFLYSIKLFICILVINLLFLILDQYTYRSLINYGEINLKEHTFLNYFFNEPFVKDGEISKIVSKINSDVPIISNWLSKGTINMRLQIIYLIICLFLMFRYSIKITMLIILLITIVFFISKYFGNKEAENTKDLQEIYEKLSNISYNSLLNIRTIKQLGKNEFILKQIENTSINNGKLKIHNLGKSNAMNETLLNYMTDILPFLAFFLGVLQYSVGTGLSLMLIARKLNEPIIIFAELLVEKKKAEEIYDRIKEIYLKEDVDACEYKKIDKFEQLDVVIEKFCYGDQENGILNHVNFSVKREDLIVICGENGRGKTTLAKMIAGLLKLDQSQGKIEYNNQNIQKISANDYYKHVLLVEQEAIIIEGTLEENLFLGDTFSDEEIRNIMYICGLENFYNERGYDFKIKENGKNISGGEKQRIVLARILLRKPEVLILDEATSNLNKDLRDNIVSRLVEYKNKNQMTLIAITHNDEFVSYNSRYIEFG